METDVFDSFQILLLEKTGIRIQRDEKWNQLFTTLGEEKLKVLIEQEKNGNLYPDWELVLKTLNISETYFFRDPNQLLALFQKMIPKIPRNVEERFQICSAGCSKGEEVYTLAILCKLQLGGLFFDYLVTGYDIQFESIEFAKRGLYSKYSVRNDLFPGFNDYLVRTDDQIMVSASIHPYVKFEKKNILIDPMNTFHLIVCRNVLIYFDDQKKKELIKNLTNHLKPGGILVLGHSEFLDSIPGLLPLTYNGMRFFQKPTHSAHPGSVSQNKSTTELKTRGGEDRFETQKPNLIPSREATPVAKKTGSYEDKHSYTVGAPGPSHSPSEEEILQILLHKLYENPQDLETYYDLSNLFWEKGDRTQARFYQAQAWTIFKNDLRLSEILKERGKWKDEWEEYLHHPL